MAAAANHSPRNSTGGGGGDALAASQSQRAAAARGPWTQVVRGLESESVGVTAEAAAAAPSSPPPAGVGVAAAASSSSSSSSSSPDHSAAEAMGESSDNAARRQVWSKPSNGAVEVGSVMGALSWPALSESTRASPKLSSPDSFKAPSDGSVSLPQGAGIASSPTPKQVTTNNANPSLTPNHVIPTRQKSMKRGGGSSSGNVTANGGFPHPQPPPPPPPVVPLVEMPYSNAGNSGLSVPESSPRDNTNKESGPRKGFGSQSHGGHDHPQQRNSFKRGNAGPYPRGDGSYHHNYRGKWDQDGGNHEWNSHRSFSGRDAHMHPRGVAPRGFMRPHGSAPFIPPPPPLPVQSFGNPMIYPEVPSPVIYVPGPPQMPLHAMFFSIPDSLRFQIVEQIDYYFSNHNLIKDIYLRQNMDDQGWVPISLIAGFKKVMVLTDNIPLILDALRFSSVVEVKDEKVRKRDEWWKWIMPSSVQFQNVSSPRSQGWSTHDMLAADIQNVSLEEKQGGEAFLSRSSSGELNSQSQRSIGEWMGQATVEAGEHSISARSSSK